MRLLWIFILLTGCKVLQDNSPVYIDQYMEMYGRGMLSSEEINIKTEQGVISFSGSMLKLKDATHFKIGSGVVILYSDGVYRTHLVTSNSENSIEIFPPPSGRPAKLEKLWFNQAHPGKYYIRSLAQRAAKAIHGGTIVVFGDSWVAGALSWTAEREPLTHQLALELPNSKIINKGISGNTILDLLERFDADVASHSPDYVVINPGVNDVYHPVSAVFFPNSVTYFRKSLCTLIGKIQAIGAKPIVIGVPPMAQLDPQAKELDEWELNRRAQIYSIFAQPACL